MNIEEIIFPKNIKIIFFDMDHTIIQNDCDVSWKQYLKDKKIVGWRDLVESKWHFFMYRLGHLNQKKFFDFQLREFKGKTSGEMKKLLQEHFDKYVKPRIYPVIPQYLETIKNSGTGAILITATNEEIARPLAEFLNFDHFIGTKLEKHKDKFTGKIQGLWCGGENKFSAIRDYVQKKEISLKDISYWGDNITDQPVLEKVGCPVACNPNEALRKVAEKKQWNIVDLKLLF